MKTSRIFNQEFILKHTQKWKKEKLKLISDIVDSEINVHPDFNDPYDTKRNLKIEEYTRKRTQELLKTCIEAYQKELLQDMEIANELFGPLIAQENKLNNWVALGIRPPPEIKFERFKHDWDTFVSKWEHKWLEYHYVWEQKGETLETLGEGFHIHALIKLGATKNYWPSTIRRDITRHFEYITVYPEKACDWAKDPMDYMRYMEGIKNNKDKEPAVRMDRIWREKQGLFPGVVKITPGN